MSLEKIFSFDAAPLGVWKTEVIFNVSGDKILLFSDTGVIVYSLHTRSVIARENFEGIALNFEWSYDLQRGEILVNFAKGSTQEQDKIYVYTINSKEKTLTLITSFDFSDFIPPERENEHTGVTSGTFFIILAFRSVYLIDPFNGQLVQKITPNSLINCFVKNVKLNWCSNEILIFYNENENQFCGQVFKLKTKNVESLLHSALKVALLNYSINDLVQMNLPKSIKDCFFK